MNEKSFLLQEDLRTYVLHKMRNEQWLTLHDSRERCENGQMIDDLYFHCCLIPNSQVEKEIQDTDWHNCSISGEPGCVRFFKNNQTTTEYKRFGSFYDYEPLILERRFGGIVNGYNEISEEFRLFHNLYFNENKKTFCKILENGDSEVIVKMESEYIGAKLKHVRQFLGIKDMSICLCFTFCRWSFRSLEELGIDKDTSSYKHQDDNSCFSFVCQPWRDRFKGDSRLSFSRMIGKVILTGVAKVKSGIWPYNQEEEEGREYPKYIYKTDENGDPVSYTCNHHLLGNYFGANPDAPHYLTRVFFKREVLEKYYNDPKYTVEDSRLTCGYMWGISIDNNMQDYVSVYLGDLGRDLPFAEHNHWLAHNVEPGEDISSTSLDRDFCAKFSEPVNPDLLFKLNLRRFREKWNKVNDWELLRDLPDDDIHHIKSLRIPLRNTQAEFDNQTISLAIVLIESLNSKELRKHCIKDYKDEEGQQGITWLHRYLTEINVKNTEEHISFLRDLQKLRSKGAAHKKDKSYEIILKKLRIDKSNYKSGFQDLLRKGTSFLKFLEHNFL